MALNTSGPISLAGATAGQSIALELGLGTATQISLNDTAVRTLAGVLSGAIIMPTNFYGKSSFKPTQQGVFAFNSGGTNRNLVSNTGVIAAAVTGAGTNRGLGGGATYGGDKGIFLSGGIIVGLAISNLVSNTGVVAGDVSYANGGAGTGTAQQGQCEYGSTGQAIQVCGTGAPGNGTGVSNLISNTGIVSSNVAAVASARFQCIGAGYGNDKGIIAYGNVANSTAKNLISNTGVVASDTSTGNAGRNSTTQAGTTYGGDKAIALYGLANTTFSSVSSLISNTAVCAAWTACLGTMRTFAAGTTRYGGDKGIIYGGRASNNSTQLALYNLISNTGVVASDTAFTAKMQGSGCSFSYT